MVLDGLTRGRIIGRPSHVEARVILLDGRPVTASVSDGGAMDDAWEEGGTVELIQSSGSWQVERVFKGGWIGVNANSTVNICAHALVSGNIGPFEQYRDVDFEFTAGRRFIIAKSAQVAEGQTDQALIDVRSATRVRGDSVCYPHGPDSQMAGVAERHLRALDAGHRSAIAIAVNHDKGDFLEIVPDFDAAHADMISELADEGVEIIALRVRHSPNGAKVTAWGTEEASASVDS